MCPEHDISMAETFCRYAWNEIVAVMVFIFCPYLLNSPSKVL